MHYTLADTIHKTFTTRAFATGIPTVLAGTPVVSAYEDDSVTQITAGITLGVDHDGVVGLNLLTLVLTGANGYEAGKDYNFVITTGTVGGVSVVGETVLSISLDRDPAFVRLGAPAGASVSADIAVIEGQTDDIGVAGAGLTAINLPNQTMDIVGDITGNLSGSVGSVTAINTTGGAIDDVVLVATTTTNTDMRGTDSALLAANINLSAGVVESNLLQMGGVVQSGTDLKDFADAGYDPVTNKVQGVVLVDTTTANTDMRGTDAGLTVLASGTAQGGSASTIQLASGETFADSEPNSNIIKITSGTGAGQSRLILSYVGATDTATVTPDWVTAPDATSVYEMVQGAASVEMWNAQAVTTNLETAVDIWTSPTRTLTAGTNLNDFDPVNDVVANVTLVATTTTNSDMRGTDSGLLAASAPTNFGDLAITVTTGLVSVGTNNDKTGYSISGTITTLDGLNNFAPATDAVANVTLVATTTTNTDQRGTDNAALASVLGTPVGADIAADIAAVKADTVIPEKNVAFSNIYVLMVDSTDHVTSKTGLTLTVQRSIDGAAFGAVTGTAAEISNGIYQFDASAADMNGDTITFRFSGTAADDTFLTIVTR